jgi:ankyrin repeat protein
MFTIKGRRIISLVAAIGLAVTIISCGSLTRSAANGDVEGIKTFLDKGENVNGYDWEGWTPLMWAVFYNQYAAVKYLLERGAIPDEPSKDYKRGLAAGSTALMICAYYNLAASARLLLKAGADRNLKNSKGDSAMSLARYYNHGDVLALFDEFPAKGGKK